MFKSSKLNLPERLQKSHKHIPEIPTNAICSVASNIDRNPKKSDGFMASKSIRRIRSEAGFQQKEAQHCEISKPVVVLKHVDDIASSSVVKTVCTVCCQLSCIFGLSWSALI